MHNSKFFKFVSALMVVMLGIAMMPVKPVQAADTGWQSPTTCTSGTWTNPANATLSDNQYATAGGDNNQLICTFNIPTIPPGNVIYGIEVSVEGSTTNRDADIDLSSDGGSNFGTNRTANFTATESTFSVGSSTDLWGRTWALGDFSTTNFRVRVATDNSNGTLSLDHIRVRVYYGQTVEINVQGNGASINDGDNSPSIADGTNFGNVGQGISVDRTFTIFNTGTGELYISSITFAGGEATDFSLVSPPTFPLIIPASGNYTITVRLTATAGGGGGGGIRNTTLTIVNNDTSENPYNFDIEGTRITTGSEIDVRGNGIIITDGDTTPSITDDTAFGDVGIGSSVTKTYTIYNTGATDLTVVAPTITGTGFSLTSSPATTITAGSSTTFQVQFSPSAAGLVNGNVSFATNDATENPYNFSISATGVNTAPTVQAAITDVNVLEDAANTVINLHNNFQDAESADASLTYTVTAISNTALFTSPAGALPIAIADPTNFTLDFAPNANGISNITIRATDPGGLFVEDTFQVTVTAVNDEPSFTAANPTAVNEDAGAQSVPGWVTAFNPGGGTDEAGQTATYSVTNASSCATLLSAGPAVSPTGTLTYTPAANANGSCTFDVAVQDNGGTANGGDDTSPTQNFTITVNAVNDAPVLTVPPSFDGTEDTPFALTGFSGNDVDAGSNTVQLTIFISGARGTFTAITSGGVAVLNSGTQNIILQGTITNINAFITGGNIIYNPTLNLNTPVSFPITLQLDDQGNTGSGGDLSDTRPITTNLTPVNDAPSFTTGADQTVDEDAGAQTVSGWATGFNPGGGTDEAGQTIASYNISNSTCGTLLSAAPAVSVAGDLTYTPAANANGSCTFDVVVQDSGSGVSPNVNTSAAATVTITVNAINDEPSFTASNPPAVNEDAGAQTVNSWATFNPGNANEAGQTASYTVSNLGASCATLLSASPTVNSAGDLTYTPAANQNGTCTFDVTVQDNGGTTNGGDDTSGAQSFTITVNALDDAPTGGNDSVTTLEDTTYTFLTTDFTYNDAEGSPFAGIRVTTLESTGTLQCGGVDLNLNDSCADVTTLTFAPVANENGAGYATFQFEVSDGSLFSTSSYTMTIDVTAVNDEPSFTALNPPAVGEDAGAQTVNSWATFDPGNASEAGQTATYSISNSTCGTLLSAGPAVNSAGNLTYTPAANQNGTCTFDVTVQDNGGTTNGGDDTSGTQKFTITVNATNDAPTETASPNQFRTDGTTAIPQGGLTNETSVIFKATATDPESDQYTLEVEVVDNAAIFTDTATCTSSLVNSGSEASATCSSLPIGSYKWQYRFVDSNSSASPWTAFDFIIDNGSPTVTNVTSTTADGTYFAGATIDISITFDENVTVTGTPQITLELGTIDGVANYVSGSGTNTLSFIYTVVVGDVTPDLDYVATTSLALNGGTIQDAAVNNANLTLPTPGAAGSLGANKAIVIDAGLLMVTSNGINSNPDTGDGNVSESEVVPNTLGVTQLIVTFNKDVYDVPASTTDPDEVDNPANYILVRSNSVPAGNFNTISCSSGVVAPDIQTQVTSVTYSNGGGSGPFVATLTLSSPLTTDGLYRLFVCGTTSIVQANNTALALAGDGVANNTDFIRNFQIATPAVSGGGGGGAGGGRGNRITPVLTVTALPATGFAPNRVTILPEQSAELAYSDLGDLWIEIPSLGVKSSIVGVPMLKEGEWDVTWLGNNVGWLDGTTFPSWEGNSVLTAHVTNANGLNGPFANLKSLKYGDQVIIHAFGQKYIFEIRNSRVTKPYATSYAFEHLEDQSYLTLITCQVYLPKSDTYMYRRVVRAVLVKVESE